MNCIHRVSPYSYLFFSSLSPLFTTCASAIFLPVLEGRRAFSSSNIFIVFIFKRRCKLSNGRQSAYDGCNSSVKFESRNSSCKCVTSGPLTDPWLIFFYCIVDVPPDTSQHQPSLIVLFLVFQLIGLVGGIIIILTARFYSPIKRHATWYNFMVLIQSKLCSYVTVFSNGDDSCRGSFQAFRTICCYFLGRSIFLGMTRVYLSGYVYSKVRSYMQLHLCECMRKHGLGGNS